MSFKIRVEGYDKPVDVKIGGTILDALCDQEIDYPRGCRTGNCGACKSVLLSGEIDMLPYSEFALSKEERARGVILPCRTVPWSDCEIVPISEDEAEVHASRKLACKILSIESATHDIRVLRMEILNGGPFDFSAGQFAEVVVDGKPERSYSMANCPSDSVLEFHVRLVPGGEVSDHIHSKLSVGDVVNVNGPYGSAYYRKAHAGPIIAVAGGSGLAPIKSIVDFALKSGAQQEIFLYFGVREERDLYLESYFIKLESEYSNLHFIPVLSSVDSSSNRRTGFVADAISKDFECKDIGDAKVYVAGPPIMVDTVLQAVKERGVLVQNFHADAFFTSADQHAL